MTARKAELNACVVGTLTSQGFLPHSRTQEARAGEAAPTDPSLRTDFPGVVPERGLAVQSKESPIVAFYEGQPVNNPAADWLDAMAAWGSAEIAEYTNKKAREDVSHD